MIKTILASAVFTALSLTSYAQVYNYNDLGILFSKDDNRGTARFNAMSGAFGALGGDISSTTINPAGAAVSKLSSISVSLASTTLDYNVNYYDESSDFQKTNFKIPQIGAMFVFSNGILSDWKRTAVYFNYRSKSNFSESYNIEGNSNQPDYSTHDADESNILFDRSLYQYIENEISGKSSVFDIGFSTVHKNRLYLGAALKIHQLDFEQKSVFNEVNDDINGNILDVEEYTESYISGSGVSFNLGFIYKFNKKFRLGLSYETPTYYSELIENYYDELVMFENTDLFIPEYFDTEGDQTFLYQYKSPNRITASGAYVFGKKGLISMDFTHKNYTNILYAEDDDINDLFRSNYRDTYSLNIGAEWRFDQLSIRGGASYEKNPNLVEGGSTNSDNVKGISLGLGYNFGKTKFDLSFNNSQNTNYYTIYNNSDLSIDKNLTQISGTLTFDL